MMTKIDWDEQVKYYRLNLENVTFWEAGKDINNLVRDGFTLSIEDLKELESKFPKFVLYAYYGDNEDYDEPDLYLEVTENGIKVKKPTFGRSKFIIN